MPCDRHTTWHTRSGSAGHTTEQRLVLRPHIPLAGLEAAELEAAILHSLYCTVMQLQKGKHCSVQSRYGGHSLHCQPPRPLESRQLT
jgi:hypothetical protein